MQTKNEQLRVGIYGAVTMVVFTALSLVMAITTPPLSGPFCQRECFAYPFANVAERFPRDYLWMYPAIALLIAYIVTMVSVHRSTQNDRKAYSHIGLSFALIAATILIVDYFLQLTVIQPSLVRGELDGVAMLSQYNPHGIFIALEELGYVIMSFSLLWIAPTMRGGGRARAMRWTCYASFVLTVASLVGIVGQYGIDREYRFEIAVISIEWIALIAIGLLLVKHFKGLMKN